MVTATDHHHGHRRVYDPESFRRDFHAAGLRIEFFGGYWLKPVSNSQLEQHWTPPGVNLAQQPWAEEAVAAIIRITNANFRLLNRLLTQMEQILEINALREVSKAVVEAARESLVIGQA